MKNQKRLAGTIKYIRETFFPKWDRKKEWIIYHSNSPKVEFCHGLCDKDEKKIHLSFVSKKDVELHLLLIHEICHCFSCGHGKIWQNKMLKIADKARKIGKEELSDKIVKQVEDYRSAPNVTAKWIYGNVNDVVTESDNELSFEEVRRYLAFNIGGYDFIDQYKRLKEVYESAIKQRRKELKMRCEFLKRLTREGNQGTVD